MIDELRALARAVALDPRLDVVAGPPGSGWSLEPVARVVRCDPDDLLGPEPDLCRGLACHEAAHAAVTRYPWLVPPAQLEAPGVAVLLNALEDCRIETWIGARLPGARAWIEHVNARVLPPDPERLATHPWSHQFALGAIHDWWFGALPDGLAAPVRQALDATAAARARVVACQPPITRAVPDEALPPEVSACFRAADRRRPPDAFERAVRRSAYEAWRAVQGPILDAHRGLVQHDLRTRPDFAARERSLVQSLRGPGTAHGEPAASRRGGSGTGDEGVGRVEADRRARLDEVLDAAPEHGWERARRAVAGLARPMAEALEPLFRAHARPRWTGGFRSGARPRLRDVMQGQADPRRRERVWERPTLPRRRDPCVQLLVDLSGSMEGEPIARALEGTVLFCEVLASLRIPFAVTGFQDVPIPLKGFDEPLDGATRQRIAGMEAEVRGARPGGRNRPEHNHDGPVLATVAAELVARPAGDRLLLVVSDGRPSGPGAGEDLLERAVQAIAADGRVHLVGLGLGPGTSHVGRYYADHLAEVPLAGLPAALGGLLRSRLGGET